MGDKGISVHRRSPADPSKPVTFAVVGFGHIGRRHAAFIQGHPGCALVATCDPLPAGELPGREAIDVPHFRSLDALLEKGPDCEVVCVCTPNGLHAAHSLQALEAGRHIVVEKPMALRKADCERVIRAAEDNARRVFCVMQNRYSPVVRWLKETVDQGRMGRIRMVDMHCFWNRDARYYRPGGKPHPWHGSRALDGGVLFTQFAHFIDLLYWVFGDVTDISARFAREAQGEGSQLEDSGVVSFRLKDDALGSLTFSTAVYERNYESAVTVLGEKGTVKIGGQYMDRLEYCNVAGILNPEPPAREVPVAYPGFEGARANHHFVFQDVVDVLGGMKEKPDVCVNEGLKTVEIIERMYGAAQLREP